MKKQNKKKIIITVTAVVLVVAIGLGVWFGVSRGRSEPVKVFAFNSVGMTEYWGDSQESYGPVSTDKIQTVFLSSTQTVTEMKVAQGDTVKKGDVLMTFDTTLSDLQLERKRLEVEKLKLDLETAQKKLKDIQNMKPMSIVSPDDFDNSDEDSDDEGDLEKDYELSYDHAYDGSESGKALICWLRLTTNANGDRVTPTVDDALLEEARQQAEKFQNENQPDPTEPSTEPTTEPTTESTTEPATEPPTQPGTEPPTQPSTEPPTQPSTEASTPSTEETSEGEGGEHSSASAAENPDEKPTITVNSYYMVFKATEGNKRMGARVVWQGMYIRKVGSGFTFQFFDATGVPDHMATDPDDPDNTDPTDPDMPDPGSGYTAAQLAQMRAEQEKTIKETKFKIKMAEADYKIMQTEMSDGNVYAEFDGKVVSVLSEDEAKTQNQPQGLRRRRILHPGQRQRAGKGQDADRPGGHGQRLEHRHDLYRQDRLHGRFPHQQRRLERFWQPQCILLSLHGLRGRNCGLAGGNVRQYPVFLRGKRERHLPGEPLHPYRERAVLRLCPGCRR